MTAEPTVRERTHVLIAGAGPAGLVLAIELARRGVPHRLIERDASHFTGSRGKGLQPRTQELFEDLGVLLRVHAFGGGYPPLRTYQGDEVVWEGRMDEVHEPTPGTPYPNALMLPQWRTGEILRERLSELGGSVELATELVSFTQDPDGVAAVVRRAGQGGQDGQDGQDEEIRADYLVGADGGRSTVRRALGVGFAGETRDEQRMIIADVRAEGVDRDYWHIWTSKDPARADFPLAMCPLAGTDTFQLVRPAAPGVPVPETTLPELQRVVDEAVGPGRIRLTELLWDSFYRANMRMAERFRVDRVFLVGDAAHVHSPAGGQGLNTSVQDAYNLGWKLAAVIGGAPAELLDTYEDERLPIAAGVLGISTKLHDQRVSGDADAHRRDDPKLQQLGLGYRGSALSRDGRAAADGVTGDSPGHVPGHVSGGLLVGDRAPDAPGAGPKGEPVRLFELFSGPHATLLAFGPRAARVAASLPERDGLRPVAVLDAGEQAPEGVYGFTDAGGHARRAYLTDRSVAADALLLVRPDGYLGLALDADEGSVDGLHDYLYEMSATPTPSAVLPA